MITYIKCEICGKEIPQKSGPRKYCTHCSNIVAREKQKKFREEHREEIRERVKELRKSKLKKFNEA